MKIRKVKKIQYITFINATLAENQEYVGKSFEAVVVNDTITGFIDWLNGEGTKTPVGDYTQGEGWDTVMFTDSYAEADDEVVMQRLQQKLSIQYGELNYDFEITSDIGIPYINKKSKDEMDLILKDEILSTNGVDQLVNFTSSLEDRHYKVEFTVRTNGGNNIWLSTEI